MQKLIASSLSLKPPCSVHICTCVHRHEAKRHEESKRKLNTRERGELSEGFTAVVVCAARVGAFAITRESR